MSTAATPARPEIGRLEFIAMMGALSATVAFAIDAMLPSLPAIANDLGAADPNARQLVITVFVLGLSVSPLIFGIAADAFGRKTPLLIGLGLFTLGAAISSFAASFELMLIGRFLQGLGASAPRTIAITIVRDRHEGVEMARVMSFVQMVFILAPVLAPAAGLGVDLLAGWRGVFTFLGVCGAALAIWAAARLPETRPARADEFSLRSLRVDLLEAFGSRRAVFNILALGALFAAFLAYLSASQQILGEAYGFGDAFVFVFGALALIIMPGSWLNARLVTRFGVRAIALAAILIFIGASALATLAAAALGEMPFWLFVLWSAPTYLAIAFSFANLTTLAMAPLGRIAGLGGALTQSLSNLVSAPIAIWIGALYDGSAIPIVAAFILAGLAALLAFWIAEGRGEAG